MGNHVSCVSPKVQVPPNIVRVIALYGDVQEFERAMKAAEVMLDNPQHFVSHSSALQTGRRILALTADDELELGQLYFLFPMHKLHSSLSPSEMASLAFKADPSLQKSTSNHRSLVRILPVFGDLCLFPAGRLVAMTGGDELDEEINDAKVETAETKHTGMPKLQAGDADYVGEVSEISMRIMKYKHWKPALETISESPTPVKRGRPVTPGKRGASLTRL